MHPGTTFGDPARKHFLFTDFDFDYILEIGLEKYFYPLNLYVIL